MFARWRSLVRIGGLAAMATAAGVVPAVAQGHGIVQGRVTARDNALGIASATVTLAPSSRGEPLTTRTGDDGRFALTQVPPGAYVLTVSASGFRTHTMPLSLEPRGTRQLAVSLEVAGVAETVNVTGTDGVGPPPSATVLSAERLQSLPPADRTGLPDALVTLAPGLIRGHDDFVHIRGHEVALNPMINGVFFWENPHALFSAGLSPEVIDTASVMTGGFAAEYGHRFGGVVDAVTKSGFRMRDKGRVTVDTGSAGQRGLSGEAGGRRGRLGAYLFGGVSESDRFLSPPVPSAMHDRGRAARVFAQLDGDLGDRGAIQVILMGDGANFQIPTTPLDAALRPLALARQETRQQTAIATWTRTWARTVTSTALYQRWSHADLRPAIGPLTAQADHDRRVATLGAKLDVTRLAGRHTLKSGLDVVRLGLRERLDYNYAGYRELTHQLGLPHIHIAGNAIRFDGSDAGVRVSVYLQDALHLSDRVRANVGLRVDHDRLISRTTHVSPRANVSIRVGRAAVHASYNRFVVAPPVESALSTSAGLTRSIQEIGTVLPPLEPTIEDQVEVGLTTAWRTIRLGAAAYHRSSDNPVHTTVWPDSRLYSYASFDRARAYGLELRAATADQTRSGLTGYLNYALGRVFFYNPVTGGFTTEAGHLTDTNRFLAPMDQTHTLTGALRYRHARTGLWMSLATEYGSGTPIGHGSGDHQHAPGEEDHDAGGNAELGARVPDHWTGNVSAGIDLLRTADRQGRLSIALHVRNITNRIYVVATEGPFSPTQYAIPRLASLSATVRF